MIHECSYTVLFMKKGSELVPYYRPKKYPVTLQRHKLLKENACDLCNRSTGREASEALEPSLIEPWLDFEVASVSVDLPTPDQPIRARRSHTTNRHIDIESVSFPEDLEMSFQSGLLDTTHNNIVTKPSQAVCERRRSAVDNTVSLSATNQLVVPDRDEIVLEYTDQTLSIYNSEDLERTQDQSITSSKTTMECNLERYGDFPSHTASKHELPLLFYPRTKKRPKQNMKIPKFSRRSRHK